MAYEKQSTQPSEIAVKGLDEGGKITMIKPVSTWGMQFETADGKLATHHLHAVMVGTAAVLVREEGVDEKGVMLHRIEPNVPSEIADEVSMIHDTDAEAAADAANDAVKNSDGGTGDGAPVENPGGGGTDANL